MYPLKALEIKLNSKYLSQLCIDNISSLLHYVIFVH